MANGGIFYCHPCKFTIFCVPLFLSVCLPLFAVLTPFFDSGFRCLFNHCWLLKTSYMFFILHEYLSDVSIETAVINHCVPNVCKNNGVCISLKDRFTCACKSGYEGLTCAGMYPRCQFSGVYLLNVFL